MVLYMYVSRLVVMPLQMNRPTCPIAIDLIAPHSTVVDLLLGPRSAKLGGLYSPPKSMTSQCFLVNTPADFEDDARHLQERLGLTHGQVLDVQIGACEFARWHRCRATKLPNI